MTQNDNLQPGRSFALELVRVTEAAAISAARFMGRGEASNGGKAAAEAMLTFLSTVNMKGLIVMEDGKQDEHGLFQKAALIGNGQGPEVDIALAPADGAPLSGQEKQNCIAAISLAERGSMWNPGHASYLNKIVVEQQAREAIDIRLSPTENLHRIAEALGKKVRELSVFVLDKARHGSLIEETQQAGARLTLHNDGDILGALLAAMPGTGIDVLMGVGGATEGLIAAAAVKALGGGMQAVRAPQWEDEKRRLKEDGVKTREVLTLDTLIRSDNVFFAATGITPGTLLDGIHFSNTGSVTASSITLRSLTGSMRFIKGTYRLTQQPPGSGPAGATPAQVAFEVVE